MTFIVIIIYFLFYFFVRQVIILIHTILAYLSIKVSSIHLILWVQVKNNMGHIWEIYENWYKGYMEEEVPILAVIFHGAPLKIND